MGPVMSINPISSTTQTTGTAGPEAMRARMDQMFSAVADKLGMTKDALVADLRQGKSLFDIARAKGMSETDLKDTIKQALEKSGAPTPPGMSVDDLAARIADQKGGPHGPRRHHGPPPMASGQEAAPLPTSAGRGYNYDASL